MFFHDSNGIGKLSKLKLQDVLSFFKTWFYSFHNYFWCLLEKHCFQLFIYLQSGAHLDISFLFRWEKQSLVILTNTKLPMFYLLWFQKNQMSRFFFWVWRQRRKCHRKNLFLSTKFNAYLIKCNRSLEIWPFVLHKILFRSDKKLIWPK